jgi:recombinational DNA repair ATPase RecF
MKVSSLHVSNLLSFDDFDLHFGEGLTVIVGPNGSGKTNVVRVLDLVNKLVDWADDRSRSIAVAPTPAETVLSSYVQAMHNDPPPGTPIDERLGALRSEQDRRRQDQRGLAVIRPRVAPTGRWLAWPRR